MTNLTETETLINNARPTGSDNDKKVAELFKGQSKTQTDNEKKSLLKKLGILNGPATDPGVKLH